MLDYKDRMNQAWDKVPEHRQKEILEELEHKAYQQDFTPMIRTNATTEYEGPNPLEPIADCIVKIMEDCADALVILGKHFIKNYIDKKANRGGK